MPQTKRDKTKYHNYDGNLLYQNVRRNLYTLPIFRELYDA